MAGSTARERGLICVANSTGGKRERVRCTSCLAYNLGCIMFAVIFGWAPQVSSYSAYNLSCILMAVIASVCRSVYISGEYRTSLFLWIMLSMALDCFWRYPISP